MKQNNWKSVLRLEKNKNGRDFVCGDIHGCFSYLEKRLKEIGFYKGNDRLFCVGDLIDRGPESGMVTDYIEMPWFYSVLGNHEEMFLSSITDPDDPDVSEDYVDNNIRNYEEWAYKINRLYRAIDSLPLVIQVGDVVIVHAAMPTIQSLDDIENDPYAYLETILCERRIMSPIPIPGISKIYVGHTIVKKPTIYGITTNIDTGAFLRYLGKEGKLTILEIREKKFT